MSKTKVNDDGTLEDKPEVFPWGDEPQPSEWIKCTGQEAFNLCLQYWKDHMVYQHRIDYLIDALWDAHTYFMKEFNSTPYRGYFGAGNNKGKTRALDIHNELCYRPAASTAPSPAWVKRVLTFEGTLLLDQAEDAFYKHREKTIIYNIFTSGYRRGMNIGQLSASDHTSFDNKPTFGAKAYNQQDDGKRDNPINRRTIAVKMITGVPKNKEIDKEAGQLIRRMFYYLSFQKVNVDKTTMLEGSIAELFDPLIISARILNLPKWIEDELYVYALEIKDRNREDAEYTLPAITVDAVCEAMRIIGETNGMMLISNKAVTEWIRNTYQDYAKISYKKIGDLIADMGIKGTKTNAGKIYDMYEPNNKSCFEKTRLQYQDDNSIQYQLMAIEREFEKAGQVIDKKGSIYRRFARLNKLMPLLEAARKAQIDEVNTTPPPDDYSTENSAFTEYLEAMFPQDEE